MVRLNFSEAIEKHDLEKLHKKVLNIAKEKNFPEKEFSCWDTLICYVIALIYFPDSIDSESKRLIWITEFLCNPEAGDGILLKRFFVD